MPKVELTQEFVNNLPACPPGKRKIDYFDHSGSGLLLEVRSSGRSTFYLRHKSQTGQTRQDRLGSSEELSLSQAKEAVQELKTKAPPPTPRPKSTLTFAQFVHTRYLPYVQTRKRSWETDQALLQHRILPQWGNRNLAEITQQDVIAFQSTLAGQGYKPGTVNRYLALIKYIFNLATRWEILPASPCKGVSKLPDQNHKERYLSTQETQNLLLTLKRAPSPVIPDLIMFLIFTGARRSEAMYAKWEDMDYERRIWTIPLSKSGKARYVPLSDATLQVLARRREKAEPESIYVFANPSTGKPYQHLYRAWHNIRTKAGIPDVRMHDLRHNFASLLVNQGRSLYEVQKLLGHADAKTTQRYAHLSQESLKEAANLVGQAVLEGQKDIYQAEIA
jgi:integrase